MELPTTEINTNKLTTKICTNKEKQKFKMRDNILLIIPETRVNAIISNIYSQLENQIDTVYIVTDNPCHKEINEIYQNITDNIFSYDQFKVVTDQLSKHKSIDKSIDKLDKVHSYLLLIDCHIYISAFLRFVYNMNVCLQTPNCSVTIVTVVHNPIMIKMAFKPNELDKMFTQIVIDSSYIDTSTDIMCKVYPDLFYDCNHVRKLQQEIKHEDIVHITNKMRETTPQHKINVYSMFPILYSPKTLDT